jgi:hypothetical protein
VQDVFVRDRLMGTTRRVSVGPGGTQGNGDSADFNPPALSADGRFVAFASAASNLVPDDTNSTNLPGIYLTHLQRGLGLSGISLGD